MNESPSTFSVAKFRLEVCFFCRYQATVTYARRALFVATDYRVRKLFYLQNVIAGSTIACRATRANTRWRRFECGRKMVFRSFLHTTIKMTNPPY
jgi:hypothetical protein